MTDSKFARRAIVTGLGAGVALTAAAARAETPAASAPARWQPTLEPQDAWMELPGRHRFVFDAISAKGAQEALFFADNYIGANKSGYGLAPDQLATIIVLRHHATVFGYNAAIWKKYGAVFGPFLKFKDPKTKKWPLRNTLMTAAPKTPAKDAVTIPDLVGKGVRFAICGAATKAIAGILAKKTKGKADAIHTELVAGLIPNAHLVPAGIVAVNRAQERGYAFSYIG